MEFVELRCGDTLLDAVVEGSTVRYNNYHCNEEGSLLVTVLSDELGLGISFKNRMEKASNTAP